MNFFRWLRFSAKQVNLFESPNEFANALLAYGRTEWTLFKIAKLSIFELLPKFGRAEIWNSLKINFLFAQFRNESKPHCGLFSRPITPFRRHEKLQCLYLKIWKNFRSSPSDSRRRPTSCWKACPISNRFRI